MPKAVLIELRCATYKGRWCVVAGYAKRWRRVSAPFRSKAECKLAFAKLKRFMRGHRFFFAAIPLIVKDLIHGKGVSKRIPRRDGVWTG